VGELSNFKETEEVKIGARATKKSNFRKTFFSSPEASFLFYHPEPPILSQSKLGSSASYILFKSA
jgi:hypothetical protein